MAREPGWWMDVSPSLPLTEHTAEVDGLELYYRMGGSGPPLLLLHGFTVVGQQWNPFLDALGEHYSVIVPDMPGHGQSATPAGEWSFREVARQMFGLLGTLGVQRMHGIGHSGGAMVLLQMGVLQPDRAEALVPVAGAHRVSAAGRNGNRGLLWEEFDANRQARLSRMHPRGAPQIRWILAQARGFADGFEMDLSPEHLATIQARTLLVWGDRDQGFPPEFALEMYRAISNCALWVIPGAGHMTIWESEEALAMFPTMVHKFFEGATT